ncbi:50S ribosomal protein L18e [Methanohalophilus sp.]|uniref:50S ribosomal protein L18e n=1 Tax=Methanohalophilus sp. TaxID=1966352 RepID=UPI002625B92D|nr:50S ribosomal protein L18e [Methanohalophilus sp.]MDK2892788.1 large subunit ribosomal protein L18e [Methanohalophilus sp.]
MSKKIQKIVYKKTDPRMPALISALRKQSFQEDAPIWKDIARRFESPRKNYAEVNISKLNRHSAADDVILVPGKVLGAGKISHSVVVGALGFSASAKEKIADAGGKVMTIEQMMAEYPKGSGIRILR